MTYRKFLNVDLFTILNISLFSARFRYMLKKIIAVILDSKNSSRCVIAMNRAKATQLTCRRSPAQRRNSVPENRRKSMKSVNSATPCRTPCRSPVYMGSVLHRIQIEVACCTAVESTVT